MTLQEIKTKLAIQRLELNTAEDAVGAKTDWLRHWDNDNRVAVSIHKETFDKLKADSTITSLALQHEERTSNESKLTYDSYRIVMYTPAEFSL